MIIPIQVIIDSELQEQAQKIFESMGLNMSQAVNLFFYNCVINGKIPFSTEMPPNLNNQYFASKIGTPYNPEENKKK